MTWERFISRIEVQKQSLSIYPTQWEKVRVKPVVKASDTEEKSVSSTAGIPPVILPEVFLPLNVNLQQLDLDDFILEGDTPLIVHHLGLSTHAEGYQINLHSFELDMPQLMASANGQAKLVGDYPLTLDAWLKLKGTELSGQELTLSARGNMEDISLSSALSGHFSALIQGNVQPLKADLPFDLSLTKGRFYWPLKGPLKGQADYTADILDLQIKGHSGSTPSLLRRLHREKTSRIWRLYYPAKVINSMLSWKVCD